MPPQPSHHEDKIAATFGPNEWLVDELYEQYLADKFSVDEAWWEFFADYSPADSPAGTTQAAPAGANGTSNGHANGATSTTPAVSAPAKTSQSPAATDPATKAPAVKTPEPAPAPKAAEKAVEQAVVEPAPQPTKTEPKVVTKDVSVTDNAPAAPRTDTVTPLRGPAARVVSNMEDSLEVPTATSVRAIPAKLLVDNRIVINNHLKRARGGKVSFTHLIGFAVVEALATMPSMNAAYTTDAKGKPAVLQPAQVNLGIAIDLPKPDGTRQLMVPAVKDSGGKNFSEFWTAYEDVVRRARGGKLTADDFAGTTISLTNPGTIGTVHSVPRLVKGQGAIIGVGAMEYPAEYQGASEETLTRLAVSKVITLTSTYDHRIIQGAGSGEFLRIVHAKLLGEDGFYDRVFQALHIPYQPIRWTPDISISHDDQINKTARLVELIHAYRVRGHLMADTDPLSYEQRIHPDLEIETHGLTLWDLDREFPTGGFGGKAHMKLRDVLGVLRDSYCRTVGIEYMHIQEPDQRKWIQDRVERPYAKPSAAEQLRILRRLNAAEAFETFLQTKYVGQKRFSLEGGESVIALLDALLSRAATNGMDEVCLGMAHRGRLNVLTNIAGKSYSQVFREFEGMQDPRTVQGSGDVKYHLGTEGTFTGEDGEQTKVYVAANPSHLEAVDPVLEGVARAKQDRINMAGKTFPVLPVLIHGDAAFAGQGVVAETLNLSQLRGYRTGGSVHVVINNQVGFTTAPASSRSSVYCTDVGRMIQAPIFHVNGDDPEACVRVAQLAFEFRQTFEKDVVIDMVCYRRRGHNEGDDPSMTQPLMYNLIEKKRSVRKGYTEQLIGRGDISVEDAEEALRDYSAQLERAFAETKESKSGPVDGDSRGGLEKPAAQEADARTPARTHPTAVDAAVLKHIGQVQSNPPEGFTVHPKLRQLLDKREQMSTDGGIDWGWGELLAFGSLLMEGTPVRLAGQDSRRGTFVSRHAVLTDRVTGDEWTPLLYLGREGQEQGKFWIYDSLLSEYAAMGFEYGYSVERPDALVLWEAQFGDFFNGAQTVIDEFIVAGQQKWGQHSSVVLLLPHGYEGQGPDHSSGRIERFLQMCAEDNMTVAVPSTPASHFHLLRRQAYARPRRPLVVFTPKSMLRLKAAQSSVEDFTSGTFQEVIDDQGGLDPAEVTRVLMCSGKVYWDLLAERTARQDTTTAIVRLEQLAPLPVDEAVRVLGQYPNAEAVWVQEEPANQGGWWHVAMGLFPSLNAKLRLVSRPASASPAAGSAKRHQAEQRQIVEEAFNR
ncbi:multifunctional oxoglutarate decarboxylase/oxoglutarate dehydrogenase thiamine pyrophosphate-binding subunit/dihydrolipoyllysine-residue succinyltransferase subunit [Kineococcus sp. GCM10028916]|uniref:multifunctional oxoglutarate decarboxylase/oxoglutarate dehydrogenase thiamine pyrophosphate-binding subunit/dihydrolipoyllysine-residue succinyltransferase subunit n=1 Tax=Kineococcus sp. GCM10028916 TaxID=3273394 RepID=UPI003643C234